MIDLTHLHPMILHFPIALLIVGFLFDVVALFYKQEQMSRIGFYLLVLGALGTIAALLSGENAGEGIVEQGLLKDAIEKHEHAAELTLWLVGVTAVARLVLVVLKKYTGVFKAAVLVLFLASVLSVARTGYYGGKLVYEHAAGVQFNIGLDAFDTPAPENPDHD